MRKVRHVIAGLLSWVMVCSTVAFFPVKNVYAGNGPSAQDYLKYSVQFFDRFSSKFNTEDIRKAVLNKTSRPACDFMGGAAVMYEATGNSKYLDLCNQTWKTLFEEWRKDRSLMRYQDDFFGPAQVTLSYKVLKNAGKIGNEYDDDVIKYVVGIVDGNFIADHNQAQERALGAARAANLFPNAPEAEGWKKYSDTIWDLWYKNRDVDEAATNYASVHIRDIIYIAKETGREELLKDLGIRKWFERYRNQQAPSGFMPEYGDDYFFAFNGWVFCFEYMARILNDPSFAVAAQKLFAVGIANKQADPAYQKEGFDMKRASEMAVLAEPALLPAVNWSGSTFDISSLVTTRTNKKGVTDIPDQLLLGASRQMGTPFVMSDLYGAGSHGHFNGRGTIQYYEVDNYPLFHGLNRRSTDARQNNTVMLFQKLDDGFPFSSIPGNKTNPNRAETNRWYTDEIDMSISPELSDTDPDLRGFRNLTFRFMGEAGMEIMIKNVRLAGPAGELMLADGSDLTNWPADLCSLSTDSETGSSVVKVTLKDNKVCFVNLNITKQFSLKDYDTVKFDWKHTAPGGAKTSTLWSVGRAMNIKTPPGEADYVDHVCGEMFNRNKVRSAIAYTKGKDSYGEIVLDHHFTEDSTLVRRMLLTEEGVLVLQDYLVPGASTDGFVAGEVWHLYTLGEKGPNWFNSLGDTVSWYAAGASSPMDKKQLLVYYENAEGRTYGHQKGNFAMMPEITYAKQDVTPGEPITFLTVLVPHNKDLSADKIAQSIEAKTTEDMQSSVSISLPTGKLDINMRKDGTWDLSRNGVQVQEDSTPRTLDIKYPKVGFDDIGGVPWAAESINALSKKGIIKGRSEGIFAPDESITRAEYLKMIVGAFDLLDNSATSSYSDVDKGAWYYKYVASAEKASLTKGIWDGTLSPETPITRQEMAAISYRASIVAGATLPKVNSPVQFADSEGFCSYASTAIDAMQQAGIINGKGDGIFDPEGKSTRAEAAKIIYGLLGFKKTLTIQPTQEQSSSAENSSPAQEESLLYNGNISSVIGGQPAGWTPQGTIKTEASVDTSVYKSKDASLKLSGPTAGWRGWRHSDIPVEGGATYKFSMYVKTENLQDSSVYVSFGVKDASGAWIVKDNDVSTTSVLRDNKLGTHDWMLIEGTYKVPDNGASISYFTPRLNTKDTGVQQTVWFDDFTMEKVSD